MIDCKYSIHRKCKDIVEKCFLPCGTVIEIAPLRDSLTLEEEEAMLKAQEQLNKQSDDAGSDDDEEFDPEEDESKTSDSPDRV